MKELCRILFGSHLYGTNTPASDKDYKAIYLPSVRDIVLGRYQKTIVSSRSKGYGERNLPTDVDIECVSLDRFLQLLMEGQTMAIDMLFAPPEFYVFKDDPTNILGLIYEKRLSLISRQVQSFLGYARAQAAKYGIKGSRFDAINKTVDFLKQFPHTDLIGEHAAEINNLIEDYSKVPSLDSTPLIKLTKIQSPDGKRIIDHLEVCNRKISFTVKVKAALDIVLKIQEQYGQRSKMAHLAGGVDFKAISHSIRVNSTAEELLTTGKVTFPRPDRELLIRVKTGQVPYEEAAELIEKGLERVTALSKNSILPENPDFKLAEDIVYNTYLAEIRNEVK